MRGHPANQNLQLRTAANRAATVRSGNDRSKFKRFFKGTVRYVSTTQGFVRPFCAFTNSVISSPLNARSAHRSRFIFMHAWPCCHIFGGLTAFRAINWTAERQSDAGEWTNWNEADQTTSKAVGREDFRSTLVSNFVTC